jgi:5-methylcytosine-specific restriction endonuclease McrA
MRGTSNSNKRGNTKDRASRKAWLLRSFESDQGPGTCRCYRCGTVLSSATVTVDRIVPGARGGTYRRNNIRPACAFCNSSTGARMGQNPQNLPRLKEGKYTWRIVYGQHPQGADEVDDRETIGGF